MEQCRPVVAGPCELDLAGHGGRREEEGEAARRRGSGGTYRPESTWARGVASGARVSVGRCQGAGQVALEGFPGSIWPRTRRGRGSPAAYGGRRAKQSNREERDGGEGLFVISKNSGTSR